MYILTKGLRHIDMTSFSLCLIKSATKVDGLSLTNLDQALIFEWHVVRCRSKKGRHQ